MKRLLIAFLLVWPVTLFGQNGVVEKKIQDINNSIDQAIIRKDIKTLNSLYADDFVFTHGTGTVDNKTSWVNAVEQSNMQFISRTHDSTHVELHPDMAIISGRLDIVRKDGDKIEPVRYSIKYVRVFGMRKKTWQLVSHRTVKEWHY